MRKKLIAGNWKMNLGYKDSENLVKDICSKLDKKDADKVDVVVCPSFVALGIVSKAIKDSGIELGAQNLYCESDGAYTGEISGTMLKSAGCEYVIIGHSERRKYLHETNSIINKKILKALESDLKVILCVGETLIEREDEIYEGIVEKQLTEGLVNITEDYLKNIVVAYEPVWAVGTGLNATPEQASEMHKFIGNVIQKLYDDKTANEILIIYGGSVNLKNAAELLSSCGIDGALIGGASLKADEFVNIVNIASKIN